ncbi:hypothetical protein GC096_00670 [Paenibacillus sp. LMG 31461]|uniref:SLH domain-containing protein n=1 Tax=Paenibacillus plantarum TaxID=2654975 RepID=A0ABX1X388_9BACL|nr:cadherin-like beta sandwich domain-containing protein [Paenibacillus plantarum]NOU62558.1 hypothetical protein [Paenibacillus plantarum]
MIFLQRQQFLLAKIALVVILFITLYTPRQVHAAAFQTNNYGASSTIDVATVDLNNDGHLDLATVLQPGNGTSSFSIRLGNGDGTFGAETAYTFSGYASAITYADFNGDSNIDLAITRASPSSYLILLGNGDGTFQPPLSASIGGTSNFIAAADFDHDGKMDLAMTYVSGSNVYVMLGNGDGTFQASTSFGTGSVTFQLTAKDFNGDGNPDLAVVSYLDRKINVLLGNGDGTFAVKVDYSAGQFAQRVATGDLNKDGILDMVVCSSSGAITILLGNGDGTFQNLGNKSFGVDPRAVLIGDYIGDGEADILIANFGLSSNIFSIFEGHGDGTFESAKRYGYSGEGSTSLQMMSGDFNEDGWLDVVIIRQLGSTVDVVLANHRIAQLQSLNLSGGAALHMPFDTETLIYTSRVPYSVYGIDVTPTVTDATATVTVGVYGDTQETVNSGQPSSSLPLNVGVNTIEVTVTAQDGTTIQTYTVDVTRERNTDASLSGLSLTGGAALSPSFLSSTLNYASTVAYSQSSIQVTPVADATATMKVKVNGGTPEAVNSGQPSSSLPLNVGVNTIEVTVTAQDGTTIQTYTVDVTRERNTDASLSGLSLTGGAAISPTFLSSMLNYASAVAYSQSSIQVTPVADATATVVVKVNGGTPEAVDSGQPSSSLPLNVGVNTIEVTVTAQDGTTTQTYTVNVTRLAETNTGSGSVQLSSNADLKQLTVKVNGDELKLTPIFTAEMTSYQAQTSASEVSIEAFASDPGASVTLGGINLVGNTTVALTNGDNVFKIIVKAENGTVKSYSLTIQRQTELAPLPVESPACAFLDIKGHWAELHICEAAEKGIVKGKLETEFDPQGLVTRVEFTTMLLRALGVTSEAVGGNKQIFTDQAQIPSWAIATVSHAVEMAIVQGYPDGSFQPMQTVTRSEMAAMLARAMKWDTQLDPKTTFADDADIPKWARESIYTSASRGLLNGREGNRLVPGGMTTRADAATVMLRVWNLSRAMVGQGQTAH